MKSVSIGFMALAGATTKAACAPTPVNSSNAAGAAFAMTNVAANNQVIAFSRGTDGVLTQANTYDTGGRGQGVDFDTQGGLTLNKDHTFLYAVNPADDLVTVFAVDGSDLNKIQTIYAGDQPLSITVSSNGYAYVLDGSVASTGIFGFKVADDGTLSPLTNSTVPTSTPIGVPGSIAFSPDNKAIIVTNKVGSTLDVYAVDEEGDVGTGPVTISGSTGIRPFSATFDTSGNLFVVESGLPSIGNTALSTYRLNDGVPSLTPLTKSEKNQQTDGCWVIVTPDDKFAYTANFVSNSISSYTVNSNGTATLIDGAAWVAEDAAEPVDLALSTDGKFLYNLLRGTGAIIGFEIQGDGSLKQVGELAGQGTFPVADGASGLAAY